MAKGRGKKRRRDAAHQGEGVEERQERVVEGRLRLMEATLGNRAWRLVVPVAIVVLSLIVSAWTFDEKLSLTGDNTEFIILARSLAQGEGMSLINHPSPRAATKYPFGFPLLLAPLAALFSAEGEPDSLTDWGAMKRLVVGLFAAAMVALFFLMADQWGRLPAVAVTAASLTCPLVVEYGHQVMSEVPYLLFSLLALFCLERGIKDEKIRGNYYFICGVGFMMWSYYVRSMGVVLVMATLLYLVQQRQLRKAVVTAIAAAAVALPWTLRNRAVGSGTVYLKQLILENPYYPDRGIADLADYIARLSYNTLTYFPREIPGALWPAFRPEVPLTQWFPDYSTILQPLSLIVIALSLYAILLCARRGQDLLLLNYLIFSTGILIVWPWPSDRFLVPLVPLMMFFTLRVVADLASRLATRGARQAGRVLAVGAIVALLFMNVRGLDRLAAAAERNYPSSFRSYYAAGQWIKENSSSDAVVCGRKPYWMYVVSGRRTVPYPFKEPPEVLASLEQHGVDYVVVGQLSVTTYKHLTPTIERYWNRFELMWQLEGAGTYVFKFG